MSRMLATISTGDHPKACGSRGRRERPLTIAAVEAERAAIDAEVVEQAARDVALQAERKAARDARYAERKARPRR